ncbi:MAG: NAD-dependent epimerase/dehydratase family protein [Candidatus Eisenbacteria bacterium]|nr:NAD-dependent epimerase/dehydratase family protein [Candidatus Eisenbacteria bacterium]
MNAKPLHVVFGAGQIGPRLARQLLAKGCAVRVVRRGSAAPPEGAELRSGDATDPAFAAEAAKGAAAIYHVMNPSEYSAKVWGELCPKYMDAMLAAASRSGARLVTLDNLYMHGRGGTMPMNESTPVAPISPKGEIRAREAAKLFAAHERGDVRAISGRASDFYGPGGVGTHFGEMLWKRVLAGQSAQVLVNPDIVHSFHYTEDVAAGLAALGTGPDDATGRWWMLPVGPALTPRQMIGEFGRALGRDVPTEQMPGWLLGVAAMFVPLLKELKEMGYQWEQPFVADDSAFRAKFGVAPTPVAEGARATVEWAKAAFTAR